MVKNLAFNLKHHPTMFIPFRIESEAANEGHVKMADIGIEILVRLSVARILKEK